MKISESNINQWVSRCGGLKAHNNKLRKRVKELEDKINNDTFMTHCSFCGQSHNKVFASLIGPKVSICNECVNICNNALNDKMQETVKNK